MRSRAQHGVALGAVLALGLLAFVIAGRSPSEPVRREPHPGTRRHDAVGDRPRREGSAKAAFSDWPEAPEHTETPEAGDGLEQPVSPGLRHLLDAYELGVLDCPEMVWTPGTGGPTLYDSVGLSIADRDTTLRAVRAELGEVGLFTYPTNASTMIARTATGGTAVFTLGDGTCTRLSDQEAYEDIEVTVLTEDGEPAEYCNLGGCGVSTPYRPGATVRVLNLAGCEITAMCPMGFAYAENTGEDLVLTLSPEGMAEYYHERQPGDPDDAANDVQALTASLALELEPEVRAALEGIAHDRLGVPLRDR